MTPAPIDLSRQGTHGCSAFFCALWNLSDCARFEMLQTDFCREMGCSQEFVDVLVLVMGYVMGYSPTISKKPFGVVRVGASEREIDKHPLRSKYVRKGSSLPVNDCPAKDLGELKARSRSQENVYIRIL